jgi:ankyrin repeat protein
MNLKPLDKVKLAAAAGLLLIASFGGLYFFLEWSTASPPEEMPSTQPAATPPPIAAGPSFADVQRFVRFVQSDDTVHAAAMLAKDPTLVKARSTSDRATPLHLAVSVAMAKLLLDNGADINALDGHSSATPLRWAASNLWDHNPSRMELVRYLQSKDGSETDIYFATAVGDIARMETIVSGDPALVNKRSNNKDVLFGGAAPIQIAAYAGRLDAVKFLLDHGANIHDRSEWKNTEAVEKASWTGAADVVAFLLDHGATVNGTDRDFRDSPLYNAATSGHADVVKILLAHGATDAPILIPDVRKAMTRAHPGDPNTGTPQEFQEILAMLKAMPPATGSTR